MSSNTTTNDKNKDNEHNDGNNTLIEVQVIIPVYNAAATIVETVQSAMHQIIPANKPFHNIQLHVCCFDDGSSDTSWDLLQSLPKNQQREHCIPATLHIQRHATSRGAGVARNRAVHMYPSETTFLCWLDSDDIMRPTRVYEQVVSLMQLPHNTLLGCQFERDPPDATWHYSHWANHLLTDERLVLEQFREVTLLQPTWMMRKSRFLELGGYIEPPLSNTDLPEHPLIDTAFDTPQTLRLAEDLRFFHQHLQHDGLLKLLRTPLVVYRHRHGLSQSSETPRKLLLRIRVLAFSHAVLQQSWTRFCIWGAGRDGKDFFKALKPELQARVYCFADVDDKKIFHAQHYFHRESSRKIPIVHFSLLASQSETRKELLRAWCNDETMHYGRIDKGQSPTITEQTTTMEPATKKQRLEYVQNSKLDISVLSQVPVVVCVAMYRTGGALEHNVKSIGRTEGKDLWFFS